jgi:hypothetical protein
MMRPSSARLQRAGALLAGSMLVAAPVCRAISLNPLDLIFKAIDSTISGDIGGALSGLNSIQNTLMQDEQKVLYPVSLINQSHNYVTTIMGGYRGWMTSVFALPVNSAQLPSSQNLERIFLSANSTQTGSLGSVYHTSFGTVPSAAAAPLAHRQMVDMQDALAQDALAQSMAADQASTGLLTVANQIENETATTAPGTAEMLAATARAAELQSLASQHKLLASMLREEAAQLAELNGRQKLNVQQMQQMNTNLQGVIAQK